jgi:hypothetical protein
MRDRIRVLELVTAIEPTILSPEALEEVIIKEAANNIARQLWRWRKIFITEKDIKGIRYAHFLLQVIVPEPTMEDDNAR